MRRLDRDLDLLARDVRKLAAAAVALPVTQPVIFGALASGTVLFVLSSAGLVGTKMLTKSRTQEENSLMPTEQAMHGMDIELGSLDSIAETYEGFKVPVERIK